MIVQVKKHHIKFGEPSCSSRCPVALSIVDIDKDYAFGVEILVSPKDKDLRGGIKIGDKHYHAPRSVERFVNRFDKDKPVKPFNFKLKEV